MPTETLDLLNIAQNGQVTIPITFRKGHSLTKGGKLFAIEVGDALVLIPDDQVFDSICSRLEAAFKTSGTTMAEVNVTLAAERAAIVSEKYGDLLDK